VRRDTRGANLVEAAIVTPLLLLLTCGIADFALILWVWLALENGASQAMRYAVTGNQIGATSREESIKTVMRQATPLLTIDDEAFVFSHLPEGGSDWSGGIGGPGDIGKVTVTYAFTPVTPLIRPLLSDGQIAFTVESAMKHEGRFE
jgi:hypothetical protein